MYIKKEVKIEEMKKAIRSGEIIYVNKQERGIGKSTLLINEALRTNGLLVTRYNYVANKLKREHPHLDVLSGTDITKTLLGLSQIPENVYVDEGETDWQKEVWAILLSKKEQGLIEHLSGFRYTENNDY